jgi:biotin synthase
MARSALPIVVADELGGDPNRTSPDWVRISYASAIALRFKSGRFTRDFAFGGINLLLNYTEGCMSDCAYCGLARTRPGAYEEKSFIRVDWPLVATDEFVERLQRHEDTLTRLCISMVTHGHAYKDTVYLTERITRAVSTPLSILVAPPTLNRERIEHFHRIGVDMIGVGLDAVTEPLFGKLRTDVPAGGLYWRKYWEVIDDAREVFGPWKVNVHTLVGLGETDHDLVELFSRLCDRQIFPYLLSFNPEPDSRMAADPKAPLGRWRRIQLAKYLVETEGLRTPDFEFDDAGAIVTYRGSREIVQAAVRSGLPFMTNGCPGPRGEPGCTRPYGSYRPSEPFRDFPFVPEEDDRVQIERDLQLDPTSEVNGCT